MSSPGPDYSVLVPAVITSKRSGAEVPASPSNKEALVFPHEDPQHSLCPPLFAPAGFSPQSRERR